MYHNTREICKICYRVNAVGFAVPDQIWNAVVPESFCHSVVCLSCFTRMADEALIPWDREIQFYPVSMSTHLELD